MQRSSFLMQQSSLLMQEFIIVNAKHIIVNTRIHHLLMNNSSNYLHVAASIARPCPTLHLTVANPAAFFSAAIVAISDGD